MKQKTMEKMKANTWQILAAILVVALVLTSAFPAILAKSVAFEANAPVPVGIGIEGKEEIQIYPYPYPVNQFSGSGFIRDSKHAEPISIFVSKGDGGIYPVAYAEVAEKDKILREVAEELEIPAEDIERSTLVPSTATGQISESATGAVDKKRKDIWSGTLTIGFGDMQEEFFLIGKESGSTMHFAVIPVEKYPVEVNKLVVERDTFPRIEIWQGPLHVTSESNFEGEWKLTAFSYVYALARGYPVPLTIATGSKAEIDDYVIKPVEIKKPKFLGFIPVGKQVAVVEIYKGDKLIAKKTLSEDQTSEVNGLILRVVKINGQLKVIAETKVSESTEATQ